MRVVEREMDLCQKTEEENQDVHVPHDPQEFQLLQQVQKETGNRVENWV